MNLELLNSYSQYVFLLPGLAVVFDALFGDPQTRFHPVALIGRLISALESRLLRKTASAIAKQVAGAVLVFLVLVITYGVVWYCCACFDQLEPWQAVVAKAILLSFAISPRSLAAAGWEIRNCLRTKNIKAARWKVSGIVGRDTDKLTTAEVTRATVETVAENIVDGIISPLFFAVLGGVPLAFLYRAVNTLDSMVGYKNDKYQDFGKVAARTDDVFNYLPARLTGMLLLIAAFLLCYHVSEAVKVFWRDASKHPSPNSGIPESLVAGALHIQLGGVNYYGGVPSVRAFMGNAGEQLTGRHIEKTIVLMYVTTLLFVFIYAGGSYLLWFS
jgi:adenosylcobinamide-phosphate synthase